MIDIEYYTDVLCVWAWVAEKRNAALKQEFGEDIHIVPKFINLFGNTTDKMSRQWNEKGGVKAFAEHVKKVANAYPQCEVNDTIWTTVFPVSSNPAHLIIKASQAVYGDNLANQLATAIRHAFYVHGKNISDQQTLLSLLTEFEIDSKLIESHISQGVAMSSLSLDFQHAHTKGIAGSPVWLLNSDRQRLYGNVGYSVLRANVCALLEDKTGKPAWY